jgi:hypothetical protein
MRDNRDNMYFPGQQGMPTGQFGPGMMGPGFPGGGFPPNVGQLENRVSSLERQVRRLDARVSRLESIYSTPVPTPYQATTPTPYATGQGTFPTTEVPEQSYPYQTSMQVM